MTKYRHDEVKDAWWTTTPSVTIWIDGKQFYDIIVRELSKVEKHTGPFYSILPHSRQNTMTVPNAVLDLMDRYFDYFYASGRLFAGLTLSEFVLNGLGVVNGPETR